MELAINDMPAGWAESALGEIAELKTGGGAPQGAQYFHDGGQPFVRVQHFDGSTEYVERWDCITDEAIKKYRLKLFPQETILFPKSGASINLEKRAKLRHPAYVVGHLCCVTPRNVSGEFLFYWLKGARFAQAQDGSTLPYLNLNEISKRTVLVPPSVEQERIAHVLSTVQQAIEQQEHLLLIATELKKALREKCFVQGLKGESQKEVAFGLIPKSWDVMQLQDTGDVIYGIQAAVASNVLPVGTPILTNKNITLDGIVVIDKLNYFQLKGKRHFDTILRKGDLLFNWRSGSKEHVGKTAYFDLEGEWVHSSFILRIRPRPEINGRYLFYYLNHLREIGYFVKLQTYSINAKFNKSAINVLPTAVPSRTEQDAIVQALDGVQAKILNAERKKAALQDLFRTLLHELMTGKVRVERRDT